MAVPVQKIYATRVFQKVAVDCRGFQIVSNDDGRL